MIKKLLLAILWISILPSSPSYGNADLEQLEQAAFQNAVKCVAPSVVRIETIGGLEQVQNLRFGTGATTGLIVTSDGLIVSSAFNFLNKPSSILVQLPDGKHKPATIVATDNNRMLTLLRIDPDGPLQVPKYSSESEIKVGQWAIGLGRAFDKTTPNISVGIVSALNRIWGKAIQTDAAVSPNNYGGPLVDIKGRVIGLLVPLSPQTNSKIAGYQWYDSGIGFAVYAKFVKESVERLRGGQDLFPGQTGIIFAGANPATAEPIIASCISDSPAQKAGLKKGDRIVEIDGCKISRASDVKESLSQSYANDTIEIVFSRQNKLVECKVRLGHKIVPTTKAKLKKSSTGPKAD